MYHTTTQIEESRNLVPAQSKDLIEQEQEYRLSEDLQAQVLVLALTLIPVLALALALVPATLISTLGQESLAVEQPWEVQNSLAKG